MADSYAQDPETESRHLLASISMVVLESGQFFNEKGPWHRWERGGPRHYSIAAGLLWPVIWQVSYL